MRLQLLLFLITAFSMTSFQMVNPNFTIDHQDITYKVVANNIDNVDFKNFSYTFDNNINYKLVDGYYYHADQPFGFDKVTLLNVFTINVDHKKYKLIELERHYGGGSSNILSYLISFTVKDSSIIMTSNVKFVKAKNIIIENNNLVLYSYRWLSSDGHSSPSQLDKGLFSLKNGDLILKSWTTESIKISR